MDDEPSGERQFAEEVGRVFEQLGVPRMTGRILGWLLICDPPRQSSAQLGSALGASKGAISTATRLLELYGLVRRIGVPGARGDFFEIAPDAFSRAHDPLDGPVDLVPVDSMPVLRHVGGRTSARCYLRSAWNRHLLAS